MNQLIAAVLVLMLGAALCLLPVSNTVRAGCGLASQGLATALVWLAVAPVLLGAPELFIEMPWGYPMGSLRFRLDALGAFFLSWSLPMTLLGAVYAMGYLRKYFDGPRHVGVHFALLNMISLSFILVYTGEHAVTFLLGWEVAALSAWLLAHWLDKDFLSVYLATSPGGLDAMTIIAVDTHADVGLVLAMQTLRLFAVIVSGAFFARLIIRWSR